MLCPEPSLSSTAAETPHLFLDLHLWTLLSFVVQRYRLFVCTSLLAFFELVNTPPGPLPWPWLAAAPAAWAPSRPTRSAVPATHGIVSDERLLHITKYVVRYGCCGTVAPDAAVHGRDAAVLGRLAAYDASDAADVEGRLGGACFRTCAPRTHSAPGTRDA
jgi:hypothetical protein